LTAIARIAVLPQASHVGSLSALQRPGQSWLPEPIAVGRGVA
jgi:hypothetical protein